MDISARSSADSSGSSLAAKDEISLLPFLDLSQLTCLNESFNHPFKSIVSTKERNSTKSYLLSDADEQLLLNLPFNQTVRVRSIVIQSQSSLQAPKIIKLLVNRQSIGFEDVEDATEPNTCAQVLDLSKDDVITGKHVALRYVRFQAVNSLHVFIASNQGDADESRIDILDVYGVPVETTKDLIGLKRQEQ